MSESVTALLSGLAQSEPCVGTVLWGCHSLAASCTPWGHPGAHSFLLLIIITALPTSLCLLLCAALLGAIPHLGASQL